MVESCECLVLNSNAGQEAPASPVLSSYTYVYIHRNDLPPHYPSSSLCKVPIFISFTLWVSLQGRKRRATNTIKSASFRSVCESCIWLAKPPIYSHLFHIQPFSSFIRCFHVTSILLPCFDFSLLALSKPTV